jgi:hypothetical protein
MTEQTSRLAIVIDSSGAEKQEVFLRIQYLESYIIETGSLVILRSVQYHFHSVYMYS